jgi:hypothetical protein
MPAAAKIAPAWRTADEYARIALGNLDPGQRGLVFVFDPDLQLGWPEDGVASVVDSAGRSWRLLAYRGNDLALRARFTTGTPTVVWIRPALFDNARSVDLTTLADLVELADAFVDASIGGILESQLPGIPLPADVAEWAPSAREDAPSFARALGQVLEFRGKPVSRRHVLAAAVVQASSKVTADAAWLDESDAVSLTTSYLHLLALDDDERFRAVAGAAFNHVVSLLGSRSGGSSPSEITMLARIPAPILIQYLYIVAAARRHRLSSPIAAIANHGLSPVEVAALLRDDDRLPAFFAQVADRINERPETLRVIAQDAERGRDSLWLGRIGDLLARVASDWPNEPTAAVRLAMVAKILETIETGPPALATSALRAVGALRFTRAVEAMEKIARTLTIHQKAASSANELTDLEDLVERYLAGPSTAEYDFVEAERDLRAVAPVLGDVRRLAARLDQARLAASALRGTLNDRLARILRNSPSALADSPRALQRWLPTRIGPRLQSEPDHRVWLLVFDGLRWDLWERVVRPEFEQQGWQADAQAGLSPLPTETGICRRALLAGAPPELWGAGGGVTNEEALTRRAFSRWVGEPLDLDYRLKAEQPVPFVADRAQLGRVNIRVFRTPDRQVHHAEGNLLDVAIQLRTYLRESVLPDLRTEAGPDDLIFVATDHGFTLVTPDGQQQVAIPPDRVHERVIELAPGDDTASLPGLTVSYTGLGRWQVATGELAFVPIGETLGGPRLRHGGASLNELVVPLAELRQPLRASGGIELELSGADEIVEDESADLGARLTNNTTDAIRGQLVFETNLQTIARLPIVLASGSSAERKCSLVGREGLETITARFVTRDVTLVARSKSLRTRLKQGIKLSGLEKLEDDW